MSSYIGGSSAHRIINCPASVRLCEGAPEPPESNEARRGTIAHKLGELCLVENIDPSDMIGRLLMGYEVDEDMADGVTHYVNAVRSWFTEKNGQTDIDLMSRLRLEAEIDLTGLDPKCKGTSDATLYDRRRGLLRIADYKDGAGVPVEIDDNYQLKYYALGAMTACDGIVDEIELTVIQPNCAHEAGPVRAKTVTPFDLIEFGSLLKHAIALSKLPNAPIKAGSHCQFCKASAFCPELYRHAKLASDMAIADTQLESMGGALTQDDVGLRLAMLEPLRHWINGVQRYAYGEAKRGRLPTGYKLVKTRGRINWINDPDKSIEETAKLFGLSVDSLQKHKPMTPRQVEKILKKIVDGKVVAKFLSDFAETRSRSVALVPASDKREAVAPDNELEFADLMESSDEE